MAAGGRGVVYVSPVPPYMPYTKFKQCFEKHGEVKRVFMKREAANVQRRRVKKGGTAKQNFVEAWVEFADVGIAKRAAQMMNGMMVGGKKVNNRWHDDAWSVRFLKGFDWHELGERQQYQKAVRSDKLSLQYSAMKKAMNFYAERCEEKRARELKASKKPPHASNEEKGDQFEERSASLVQDSSKKGERLAEKANNGELQDRSSSAAQDGDDVSQARSLKSVTVSVSSRLLDCLAL